MSKQRKSDEIFELKRLIKEFEEEVTRLNRQISNSAKEDKRATKAITKAKFKEALPVNPPVESLCPACKKGTIEAVSLGPRTMLKCTLCKDYKKVIKTNG